MSSSSGNRCDPVLDLRGEVCPYTFVRARLRLEQMAPGERLVVVVDHEPATRNVPRSAREWGQEVGDVREVEPGVWHIPVTKRTDERT
ncbi:MAG: sulfurtransferase TusA family protein [Deltaproteobacteria bacterium]|nr:MAG: sulfurtransferase TusA family protein [Deltaproteobacteria bacterium]